MTNWILFGLIEAYAITVALGCTACDFGLPDYEQLLPYISEECFFIFSLASDNPLRLAHFEESRLFGEYWNLFITSKNYYDRVDRSTSIKMLHGELYQYEFDVDACDEMATEVEMVLCKCKFRVHMILRLYDIAYATVKFGKTKDEFMQTNSQYL